MIKVEHTLFALPFAFMGMMLAAGGWPPWRTVGWIVAAMVLAAAVLVFAHNYWIGAPVMVAMGGLAAVAGAWWFGLQLPKIRVEARRLIVAQAMAGGEPAEEMTVGVAED